VTAVTGFYADLRERGSVGDPVSCETIRGVHRVLSMVLKRATIDGLVRINPCTVAKVPKDDAVESREDDEPGIDPESARRFVAAASGTSIETIAAIALGTGLRVSELLGLKWDDVDLAAGMVHVIAKLEQVDGVVERTVLKTRRSRRDVPIGANVAAIFKQQKRLIAEARLRLQKDGWWVHDEQDGHWVFPTLHASFTRAGEMLPAGRWWPPDAFQKTWRRGVHHANEVALAEYVLAGGKVEDFEPPWSHGMPTPLPSSLPACATKW
jgi:integrase